VVLVILLAVGLTNLVTKEVATISGVIFTAGFFLLFTASERAARRKRAAHGMDEFQLIRQGEVDLQSLEVRPAPVLVPLRDFRKARNLELALTETDTAARDVVGRPTYCRVRAAATGTLSRSTSLRTTNSCCSPTWWPRRKNSASP
jgi:hypothetical protein